MKLFYPVVSLGEGNVPNRLCGTAFPIALGGGLLTCRHVVEVASGSTVRVAVLDPASQRLLPIAEERVAGEPRVDLALLSIPTLNDNAEFFPILDPDQILIGKDVDTFGYYSPGGLLDSVRSGMSKGSVVSIGPGTVDGLATLTLSYAAIEGLSGSPRPGVPPRRQGARGLPSQRVAPNSRVRAGRPR